MGRHGDDSGRDIGVGLLREGQMKFQHLPPDCPRMNKACEEATQRSVETAVENQAREPHEFIRFGEAERFGIILAEARAIERELNQANAVLTGIKSLLA